MDEEDTAAGSLDLAPVPRYDTLTDRTYQQLRSGLMAGSFHPGQKLTIRKIAAVLGISATPAHSAMSRLVSEQILEWGPNRSAVVPQLTADKVRELYVIRLALEGTAAELGAPHFDAEAIDALERTQLALVAAMDRDDYKQVLLENEEFHFALYRAAGLPMLTQMIQSVWLKLGPSLNFLYPAYSHSRKGVHHHTMAIKALRAGDAAAVRQAIESDLRDGRAELTRALAGR